MQVLPCIDSEGDMFVDRLSCRSFHIPRSFVATTCSRVQVDKRRTRRCRSLGILLGLLFMVGCFGSQQDEAATLFKLGSQTVTVEDFNRSHNLMRAGMREVDSDDVADVRDEKLRLIRELTEEAALLERAQASGITLSAVELEAAVDKIRSDYPDDTFEQVLIENAIPFSAWKKELEKRLIIEKLLQQEVFSKVEITEDELAAFYKEQRGSGDATAESDATADNIQLVEQLKRAKAEARLDRLMDSVKNSYKVEINETVLAELLKE